MNGVNFISPVGIAMVDPIWELVGVPVAYAWTGTKQLGTTFNDRGYWIEVDSSGNIYVTGRTGGFLDGNTGAEGSDIFLVNYNSDGVKR